MFVITANVVLAVQPFNELTAVTVYVPPTDTIVGFAAPNRAPPFHNIVEPALKPVIVVVPFDTPQIMVLLLNAVTIGKVVLDSTDNVEVALQPVKVFVAVTV